MYDGLTGEIYNKFDSQYRYKLKMLFLPHMKLSLNPAPAILLTLIALLVYIAYAPLIVYLSSTSFGTNLFGMIGGDTQVEFSFQFLLIESLAAFLFYHLSNVMVTMWFVFNVPKLGFDRLTWVLLGLVFGAYSLPLFFLMYYLSNGQLSVSQLLLPGVRILLALLIVALIISRLQTPWEVYSMKTFDISKLGSLNIIRSMKRVFLLVIMALTNLVLATSVLRHLKAQNKAPWFWTIATLFLGIVPIFVYVSTSLFSRQNKDSDALVTSSI